MGDRKIIQITSSVYQETPSYGSAAVVYALCNDGTVWEWTSDCQKWSILPDIPQSF